MTSQNEFVDKVMLQLIGKLSSKDTRLVKDSIINVLADYEVSSRCAEIIVSEYILPDCYKMYIATKTMNGEFSSEGTIKLYKDVIEKMLYGDEINAHGGKRREYRCKKCGIYKWN